MTLGRLLAVFVTFATASHGIATADTGAGPYAGRPLKDALQTLGREGLKIIFSTELVRSDMLVSDEPRATSPRKILDEILRPHGLRAKDGPRGTVFVVPAPKRRPARAPPVPKSHGSLRGRVLDAHTGAPLHGVLVQAPARAGSRAYTDAYGAFRIDDLPAGDQHLVVVMHGFMEARPDAVVPVAGVVDLVVPLVPRVCSYTEQITVTDSARAARGVPPRLTPAEATLGGAELEQLRSVLTDDPVRVAHAMPGVAANDDFRGDFSVRGAGLRHIGMSIDGVMAPWLVHTIEQSDDTFGSVALLNREIVDRMSLAAGAYPLHYGNRTGAWLDTTIREGSRNGLHVQTMLDGGGNDGIGGGGGLSVVAEGPIGPSRRGSWLTAFRADYPGWLTPVARDNSAKEFGFADFQSKLVYDVARGHQIQTTFVVGGTYLDNRHDSVSADRLLNWHGAGLGILALQSTLSPRLVVSQRVSVAGQGFGNTGAADRELSRNWFQDVAYRADVSWAARPETLVQVGMSAQQQHDRQTAQPTVLVPSSSTTSPERDTIVDGSASLVSGYAQMTWQGGAGWSVAPGVRVTRSSLIDETAVLPSVRAAWDIRDTFSVRAAAGWYRQTPEIEQVLGPSGGAELGSEQSRHLDVGVELRPKPFLRAQVTLYDRQDRDFLRLEDADYRLVDGSLVAPAPQPQYANALRGRSRGVELLLARDGPSDLTGWVSYAYGRTRYTDAARGETFWGDFDQRHTVNAHAHYRLTDKTSVGATFRFGSNFPMPGYIASHDGELVISDRRNETRLPPYARLDARVNRTFTFWNRRLTFFFEVLNVLGRKNYGARPGVVDAQTGQVLDATERLFPVLPSAGLQIEF
ncbi:MAG: hypothetical protein GEV06_13250 [Luteitalea sp.]|nr:hypothetical protein [Luteitalea sp.]